MIPPISPILPGRDNPSAGALVVNIFGGPGTGKSVLASDLFATIKKFHVEAACPEEHAKLALRMGQDWILDQQLILLGRTWETIHALQDKAQVILVDSPLLLCSVYAGPREPQAFHDLVWHMHKRHTRLNVILERNCETPYSPIGRREDEQEARAVDGRILACLDALGEPFLNVSRNEAARDDIAGLVLAHCRHAILAA